MELTEYDKECDSTSANFLAFPVTKVTGLRDISPSEQIFFEAGTSVDIHQNAVDRFAAHTKANTSNDRVGAGMMRRPPDTQLDYTSEFSGRPDFEPKSI